jgi:hypothetical protein
MQWEASALACWRRDVRGVQDTRGTAAPTTRATGGGVGCNHVERPSTPSGPWNRDWSARCQRLTGALVHPQRLRTGLQRCGTAGDLLARQTIVLLRFGTCSTVPTARP